MALKTAAAKEVEALKAQLAEMQAKLRKQEAPTVPEIAQESKPIRKPKNSDDSYNRLATHIITGKTPAPPPPQPTKPKKAKNSGPWSLREDGKVAHNGRVLQAERAAHYPTADGGAVWIVGRTVENRSVFHATGIDGAGNALTPATFAGSPEVVCVILNAYCATLGAAQ